MNKLKFFLTGIAVISAMGGVFASRYDALTKRLLPYPGGTGFNTVGGVACVQISSCPGGLAVCYGIRQGTTSTLTTLRSSDSVQTTTHCGQTLGRSG